MSPTLKSLQFLQLLFGAIVLSISVSACGTSSQFPTTPSASVDATASTPRPSGMMDHSTMNQGMMNHSMDLGPADADYDLRFIDAMILHHEGAVVMAKDALKKSARPELKKLATAIVSDQDKEIIQMQQWRKDWYPKAPNSPMAWNKEMNYMMAMKPDQMSMMSMNMDLGKADSDYDLRFINAMIPHHEAAVVMAKDLAINTKRPELQKFAKDVVTAQQSEIDQMNQWRKTWYGK